MNKTILFCTIIALTGCKSLDYVKSGKTVMEGNSLKNIDELSGCISRQWAGNGTPITSLPIENGVSLLVPQAMGGYDVVLDIKKAGNLHHQILERCQRLEGLFQVRCLLLMGSPGH
ncbi:hypothetical protein [Escherichia coli]|uniref:hypothetical protein n=1 Tax=Escherichia coli TaxID=562 RepID=UPI00207B9E23|nr:hypothetical protein [Escherichia coli]